MRIRISGLIGVSTVLALVIAASTAYADEFHVTADIPFAFQAEGKTLPAGHYDFTVNSDRNAVRVVGTGRNEVTDLVETRLSKDIYARPTDAHVVFDVVNGRNILSEVWESGFDGFLLASTKEAHTHRVISGKG